MDTPAPAGFFLDYSRMIVSKCCNASVFVESTRCGYTYYCCDKCCLECDTAVSFLFPDDACDKLYSIDLTKEEVDAKV